jgi:hypothetical protein
VKTAVQLAVTTAYFLAVSLLTFGAWFVLSMPFVDQRADTAAGLTVLLLVACIGAGGYLGLRGFGWVQKRL